MKTEKKNASKLAPAVFTANGLDTDRPLSEVVEKPIRNHDDNGRFVTGNNLGQGRPVGSRNQLSEAFCEALRDDFAKHGHAAIVKLREEDPATYVRVIATLVPKEIRADIDTNITSIQYEVVRVDKTAEWVKSVLEAKPVRTPRTPGNEVGALYTRPRED